MTENAAEGTSKTTAPKKRSGSSSSGNKNVWGAIDALTDYVTRHGDEGGLALRAQLADLKPGKTQAVGAEDDPALATEDDD